MRKPFPARVDWLAVWSHRWVILNFLNQVAYGDARDSEVVCRHYGGDEVFARDLYDAARACIRRAG